LSDQGGVQDKRIHFSPCRFGLAFFGLFAFSLFGSCFQIDDAFFLLKLILQKSAKVVG
jgi:hypothetical protein